MLEVIPYVAIDGLMSDAEQTFVAQMARHLLRAPPLADEFIDQPELLLGEALIAPGSGTSPTGLLHRSAWSVAAVVARAIALELSTDGAAMAPEMSGDLSLIEALLS